ncbi:MAG: hypothetical protein AB8B78_12565 [Polaribacter sp.]
MSKKLLILICISFLFFSCQKETELQKLFYCKISKIDNLGTVNDVKNLFSVEIPKNWNTNLYQDAIQSSIFSADTTKQLSETLLLDISYIKNEIVFNDSFKLKIEQENLSKNLIQKKSNELIINKKPSYLVLSKGKKSSLLYQKLQVFLKVNPQNFILVKTEIYGDSLVNERICKAIAFIEKIKILP